MRIAISGASGRMGQMIIDAAKADSSIEIAALVTGSETQGQASPVAGICYTADIATIDGSQVLIDFSRPQATLVYIDYCVANRIAMVIGTTGFDAAGRAKIEEAAKVIPIVFAPNMSVGVNATLRLLELAGRLLREYDCEIVEMHHKHKVDAPSGTALEMGRTIARARGVNFDDVALLSREGHTGERVSGTIGFASLRGGDVVGDHTVIFAGTGERIEISHKSGSRAGYAAGAIAAAKYLQERPAGLYTMRDVTSA